MALGCHLSNLQACQEFLWVGLSGTLRRTAALPRSKKLSVMSFLPNRALKFSSKYFQDAPGDSPCSESYAAWEHSSFLRTIRFRSIGLSPHSTGSCGAFLQVTVLEHNALPLGINTTDTCSFCLLPLQQKPLNTHPFTKVALRIWPILVEAAVMNDLDEIIRMNELKMRNTELEGPWSNTQLWIIKSHFYSLHCFPEMWNWMKGKQTEPKKAHVTLPVMQHMTWSRHTHLQELGILLPGIMQSQVHGDSAFQWDSQVVITAWCASSAAALDLIGSLHTLHVTLSGCVTKNGAKTTPEGKAEALVDAIRQCSHERSHSLRLPLPPSPFASHCRHLWWSLKMHWPKVQVAQQTTLIVSRDMISSKLRVHEIGLQDGIRHLLM